MKFAEKWRRPLISLIDVQGAYPGLGAEERGQAEAIAHNLREMARLKVRRSSPPSPAKAAAAARWPSPSPIAC